MQTDDNDTETFTTIVELEHELSFMFTPIADAEWPERGTIL